MTKRNSSGDKEDYSLCFNRQNRRGLLIINISGGDPEQLWYQFSYHVRAHQLSFLRTSDALTLDSQTCNISNVYGEISFDLTDCQLKGQFVKLPNSYRANAINNAER